jgi:hypothetical protein
VQAICGNCDLLYGVFLDRFVPSEKLQILLSMAIAPWARITILTNGFIDGWRDSESVDVSETLIEHLNYVF